MDRTSLLTLTGTDPSRSLQRAMLDQSPVPRQSEERGTSAQDQLDFLQQLRAPQTALNMSAPVVAPERQGLQLSDLTGHPPSPFQMTQFQLERPADGLAYDPQDIATGRVSDQPESAEEAMEQFVGETFYGMLMKQMRNTVVESDLWGNSSARKMFESQLDQTLVQQLAQNHSQFLSQSIRI